MVIGVLQFELLIPGAQSLKDKRAVVRSVRDKLTRELRISVAEVAGHDNPTVAMMGAALVATDGPRAHELLDRAWNRLKELRDGQIGGVRREIIVPTREEDAPPVLDERGPDADALQREMLEHYGHGQAGQGQANTEGGRP